MSNIAKQLAHKLSCRLYAIRRCSEPMRFGNAEYIALVSHMNGVAMVIQRCQLPLLYWAHEKAYLLASL